MNILLDTHMLLWVLTDDPQLPAEVKNLVADDINTVYYSMASVWEVAIKHNKKPDQMLLDDEAFVKGCRISGFKILPITEKQIAILKTLERRGDNVPEHHDPFDRLLLAQAKTEHYTFITHDSLIKYYNEPCVMTI